MKHRIFNKRHLALAVAALVAGAGVAMMQISGAATFVASFEAENGTTSTNAEKLTAQTGASGSSTVRFSSPPTPNPNPIPTRQIKIMPLGSSSVEGVGSSNGAGFRPELYTKLVQEDGLNVDFVGSMANGPTANFDRNHEGHSGWSIGNNSSLSASVTGWLTTYKPDVMLFYAGLNDMRGGATGAETATRFDAIAAKIYATSPNIKLIASTTMKTTDNPALQEQVRQLNIRMEPIAQKYRDQGRYLRIVDIDAVITPADHSDTIHANDAGYRKMVPVWLSGIRAAYPSL